MKPDFDQIKDVVKAAGGDVSRKLHDTDEKSSKLAPCQITRYISGKTRIPKDDQDPLILISCEEDRDIWENVSCALAGPAEMLILGPAVGGRVQCGRAVSPVRRDCRVVSPGVFSDKELLFASILKMELNMDEHKLEI